MPDHNTRRAVLLDAIRRQRGEWTTGRVWRLYRSEEIDAPLRATARGDLHYLTRAGFLVLHDEPSRRFFTLVDRPSPAASSGLQPVPAPAGRSPYHPQKKGA